MYTTRLKCVKNLRLLSSYNEGKYSDVLSE